MNYVRRTRSKAISAISCRHLKIEELPEELDFAYSAKCVPRSNHTRHSSFITN